MVLRIRSGIAWLMLTMAMTVGGCVSRESAPTPSPPPLHIPDVRTFVYATVTNGGHVSQGLMPSLEDKPAVEIGEVLVLHRTAVSMRTLYQTCNQVETVIRAPAGSPGSSFDQGLTRGNFGGGTGVSLSMNAVTQTGATAGDQSADSVAGLPGADTDTGSAGLHGIQGQEEDSLRGGLGGVSSASDSKGDDSLVGLPAALRLNGLPGRVEYPDVVASATVSGNSQSDSVDGRSAAGSVDGLAGRKVLDGKAATVSVVGPPQELMMAGLGGSRVFSGHDALDASLPSVRCIKESLPEVVLGAAAWEYRFTVVNESRYKLVFCEIHDHLDSRLQFIGGSGDVQHRDGVVILSVADETSPLQPGEKRFIGFQVRFRLQ